jgi:hypothetical protein
MTFIAAAIVVVGLLGASNAFAAKPASGSGGKHGGGGTSGGSGTISLVLLNSTDGLAHYGQQVTFKVSTTATTQPYVDLQCYQGRVLVGQSLEGFFTGSLSDGVFELASPMWTSGAADCTATLQTPQGSALASTSFHVYA